MQNNWLIWGSFKTAFSDVTTNITSSASLFRRPFTFIYAGVDHLFLLKYTHCHITHIPQQSCTPLKLLSFWEIKNWLSFSLSNFLIIWWQMRGLEIVKNWIEPHSLSNVLRWNLDSFIPAKWGENISYICQKCDAKLYLSS